jgi:hypothetical protein
LRNSCSRADGAVRSDDVFRGAKFRVENLRRL